MYILHEMNYDKNVKWCSRYGKYYDGGGSSKVKRKRTISSSNSTSEYIKQKAESWRDVYTPVFLAALFAIDKM